jgi:hypothetical protein
MFANWREIADRSTLLAATAIIVAIKKVSEAT